MSLLKSQKRITHQRHQSGVEMNFNVLCRWMCVYVCVCARVYLCGYFLFTFDEYFVSLVPNEQFFYSRKNVIMLKVPHRN